MNKALKWDFALLLITIIWGAGFTVIKLGLETISPLWFIGIRFLIASIVLALIFRKKLNNISKNMISHALVMGSLLFATFALVTIALNHTTATNTGFYGGLAVLFTPFFSYIFNKEKIKKQVIIAVLCAILGVYLLSGSSFNSGINLNIGDLMSIGGSLVFALLFIVTDKGVKEFDAELLTLLELIVVSVLGIISASIFESFPREIPPIGIFSLLFTGVLGSSLVMILQNVAQRYVASSHVAIIFCMEPVFGAVTSFLVLHENIGARGIVGCLFIIGGLLIAEIVPDKRLEKVEISEEILE